MLSPVLSHRPSHEVQYFAPQPQSPTLIPRSSTGVVNMSWCRDEPLDFSSSHPLTSCVHMSMSMSPGTSVLSPSPYTAEGSVDHIPSLERDFCSNFTCCGLRLADLHELLEHFEESHIVVVSADGIPIYPCLDRSRSPITPSPSSTDSSTTSSPSADCDLKYLTLATPAHPRAPYSGLIFNYPQPNPNPFPAFSLDPDRRILPPDSAMEVDVMADFDAFDTDYSAPSSLAYSHFHTHASSSQSSLCSSSSSEPLALPPSSFTATRNHEQKPKHKYNRLQKLQDSCLFEDYKGLIGLTSGSLAATSVSDRRRSGSQQGQKVPKKREKMFRCPRPGCTKSYLNPNGLKYHVEKGTCKIESDVAPEAI